MATTHSRLAAIAVITIVATAAHAGPTGTLVVLNKAEASASLLALPGGREIARLPTGEGPHEVAVSPDGRTAVVADYGQRTPGSTLTVIDLPARKVVRTIDLGEHRRPHGIEYLDDGRRVVVTTEHDKHTVVVDVVAGDVVTAIETGQDVSHMVVVDPAEKRAFVANIGSGTVSVLDLESGVAVATIETGAGAEGIDISPSGEEVWVSNRAADSVSVIDVESLEVVAQLPCKAFPIRVKFAPDGKHVLVSNARSGDVAVFDALKRNEVKRVSMRESGGANGRSPVPVGILVLPDGSRAFVANTNADLITVIDPRTWTVAGRLRAGDEPDGMAYSPLVLDGRGDGEGR